MTSEQSKLKGSMFLSLTLMQWLLIGIASIPLGYAVIWIDNKLDGKGWWPDDPQSKKTGTVMMLIPFVSLAIGLVILFLCEFTSWHRIPGILKKELGLGNKKKGMPLQKKQPMKGLSAGDDESVAAPLTSDERVEMKDAGAKHTYYARAPIKPPP